MGLFDRVFRGSDEMYFKAEAELNNVIAELGESAPMTMPDTAYFLACIYAYLGKKVTTLGELKEALAELRAMMGREYKTKAMVAMLEALGAQKKSLIVLPEVNEFVIKSCANIPGVVTTQWNTINVYDILNCDTLVVDAAAVKKIEEVYA